MGISLIVDERNQADLVAAAEEIRRAQEDSGGGVDYCIVRPVMNYSSFYRPSWSSQPVDEAMTRRRAEDLGSPMFEGWGAENVDDLPGCCVHRSLGDPRSGLMSSLLSPHPPAPSTSLAG